MGAPDIVFTGKQTIDGDTAQVGPGIARRLGLNQLTYVAEIGAVDLEESTIEVERRAEGGVQVLIDEAPCSSPCWKAPTRCAAERIDSALRAARAEIITWNAAEAGIDRK